MKNWSIYSIPSQSGKTAIVTGANVGLGFETAKALAQKGMKVIMACRNPEKASKAKAQIIEHYPNANLELIGLDLSDLKSIDEFVETIKLRYTRLDVLINNAGVMVPPYTLTPNGFELQFGVNHLGHFYLTAQLFDLLIRTPDSRVVPIASIAHKFGSINFSDIHSEHTYSKQKAYAQSKLANLLFSFELDRRLKAANLSTKAIAAHPGVSATNLVQYFPGIAKRLTPFVAQSAAAGAQPTLMAALCSQLKGGEYIGPSGFLEMYGRPTMVGSSKKSRNKELAEKLWTLSEQLVGVEFTITK